MERQSSPLTFILSPRRGEASSRQTRRDRTATKPNESPLLNEEERGG
jgi:hypothetical protein